MRSHFSLKMKLKRALGTDICQMMKRVEMARSLDFVWTLPASQNQNWFGPIVRHMEGLVFLSLQAATVRLNVTRLQIWKLFTDNCDLWSILIFVGYAVPKYSFIHHRSVHMFLEINAYLRLHQSYAVDANAAAQVFSVGPLSYTEDVLLTGLCIASVPKNLNFIQADYYHCCHLQSTCWSVFHQSILFSK